MSLDKKFLIFFLCMINLPGKGFASNVVPTVIPMGELTCFDILSKTNSDAIKKSKKSQAKDLTQKMAGPTLAAAILAGAVIGPAASVGAALPLGIAHLRDKVKTKRIMNTFRLFEVANLINSNQNVPSKDWKKLRFFHRFKSRLEKKMKMPSIDDKDLAKSIIKESSKKINDNFGSSLCSFNKHGQIEVNPLNNEILHKVGVVYENLNQEDFSDHSSDDQEDIFESEDNFPQDVEQSIAIQPATFSKCGAMHTSDESDSFKVRNGDMNLPQQNYPSFDLPRVRILSQ